MNKIINIITGLSLLFAISCGSESNNDLESEKEKIKLEQQAQLKINLADIEQKLKVESPKVEDMKKATTLFQSFVGFYPEHEKAADYLLRASDLSKMVGNYPTSVKLLSRIIETYPDYNQLQSVYYNRASHTDFEIGDTTLAKLYYFEVIQLYPNTQNAIDAQTRIDQHFMSEDQLVELWMKNIDTTSAQ